MSPPVITISDLSKSYRLGAETAITDRLTEAVSRRLRQVFNRAMSVRASDESDWIWALRKIDLEIHEGEVLGVIGRNGAGKSTLLKILSRITHPTEGYARVRGRVSPLLEVGTGFHPELTGRENVYLNAAILGMSRVEIERKFEEIVEFAEVSRFIDTPVKRYSSGMQVRLAFAVAAHIEPEILIVDEVLAVGDAAFQRKCLGRMSNVATQGRTVLFVSHNLRAVAELCTRCVWLDNGQIRREGGPSAVITEYLSSNVADRSGGPIPAEKHLNASGDLLFKSVDVVDNSGMPAGSFKVGSPFRVQATFDVQRPLIEIRLIVIIERLDGVLVTTLHNTDLDGGHLLDLVEGTYAMDLAVSIRLMPGTYAVHLGAKPAPDYSGSGPWTDWVQNAIHFSVEEFSEEGRTVFPTGAVVQPTGFWSIETVPRDEHARKLDSS